MPDHATSTDPAVQAQLDRLTALSPGADILGLERITLLLGRLGNPQRRLPPVFHVAGTNGKGSTCAFLRAALEAAGHSVHVYSSPHLVRFNERIRLAGQLIDDAALAALLNEVLDVAGDIGASFFEVTTAAAFLAFARTPAAATIVEVGLGGRLDATNVVAPLVTGIAQLGIDHQAFLGDTAEAIAGEKAGIAKRGVPLITMRYPPSVAARVASVAAAAGAPLQAMGEDWSYTARDTLRVTDADSSVETPLPTLAGPHQPGNLALGIAMLRRQRVLPVPESALAAAAAGARWPARMQRLAPGPLTALLPPRIDLWLDGGHNEAAGEAIAATLVSLCPPAKAGVQAGLPPSREHKEGSSRLHLVLGMLANKDAAGLLAPIAPLASSLVAVPITDHEHHVPPALAQTAHRLGIPETGTADTLPAALRQIADRIARNPASQRVLILGSLYLAGEALRANDEYPD